MADVNTGLFSVTEAYTVVVGAKESYRASDACAHGTPTSRTCLECRLEQTERAMKRRMGYVLAFSLGVALAGVMLPWAWHLVHLPVAAGPVSAHPTPQAMDGMMLRGACLSTEGEYYQLIPCGGAVSGVAPLQPAPGDSSSYEVVGLDGTPTAPHPARMLMR